MTEKRTFTEINVKFEEMKRDMKATEAILALQSLFGKQLVAQFLLWKADGRFDDA